MALATVTNINRRYHPFSMMLPGAYVSIESREYYLVQNISIVGALADTRANVGGYVGYVDYSCDFNYDAFILLGC